MEVLTESADRKHGDHDDCGDDDDDDDDAYDYVDDRKHGCGDHNDCGDDDDAYDYVFDYGYHEDDDYAYEDENRSRGSRTSRGRVGHAGHTRLAY